MRRCRAPRSISCSRCSTRFGDKTVLVIGAGEMGRLTLNHIRELNPARVLVTNRSPEKAAALAADCGGQSVAWEQLDDGTRPGRHRAEHDRRAGADRAAAALRREGPLPARRPAARRLRHGRAARLRPAHPRRRPRQRLQRGRPHPRGRPGRRPNGASTSPRPRRS